MYSEKNFLMVKSFGQHLSKTTAHDLSGCFGVTNFSTFLLFRYFQWSSIITQYFKKHSPKFQEALYLKFFGLVEKQTSKK